LLLALAPRPHGVAAIRSRRTGRATARSTPYPAVALLLALARRGMQMAQPKRTVRVRVVVDLALAEASVLAWAAVVVTSALDRKEVNAAEQGLLAFRAAVGLALSKESGRVVGDQPGMAAEQPRRAS